MRRAHQSLRRETMELQAGERWFQVAVDPVLDAPGRYAGAVHIVSDITERKRAEEALHESEERFRTAFEEGAVAMALTAMDSTLLKVNSSFCRMLGFRESELVGKSFAAITHPDDRAPKPMAEDVRVVLFQSVRELLINAIKHAHAHEVALDISRVRDSIRITVADDGAGFDAAQVLAAPSRSRGLGLFNVRERLDFVGGTLDIDSRPRRGSRFTLVAPLEMHRHIDTEARGSSVGGDSP